MKYEAALFDMDGVLVDSERFINEAAVRMFREHGLHVRPADFLPFVGAGENRYLGGVAERYGFSIRIERDKARTYEIYQEIIRGRLEPLPGAVAFVEDCRSRGLRLALATSADRVKMEANLREIGLPVDTFDATVNGLDVEHKKPHPDIYLRAAELVGVAPADCFVVEDAVNGVEAAKRAGCACLAVTGSFSPEELGAADWVVDRLDQAIPLVFAEE
jgi:beta-phosphoglucomutase